MRAFCHGRALRVADRALPIPGGRRRITRGCRRRRTAARPQTDGAPRRRDMADRGLDVARGQLAKLPPSETLTTAERRTQYERAEKVFPTPAEVKIERVSAPAAPAARLRPPSAGAGRGGLFLPGG